MRTTVDLPAQVHERAREIARRRDVSMSAVVADLATRGLATLGDPITLETDPISGFPVVSLGYRVTGDDVASALDDD